MAEEELAELFLTQKSLTEWFEDIKHRDAAALRREDNEKHHRLGILNKTIGLPYDEPTQFEARELKDKSPAFAEFLKARGDELCALRLIPKAEGLPKIRMRGKSIKGAYKWFLAQDIDASKYRADFLPHETQQVWSTIFIVNRHGMQGEIIYGKHHQLTQGFHGKTRPHTFRYDFAKWSITPVNAKAVKHLQKLASHLLIKDKTAQKKLYKHLKSTFANDYLEGYFETIDSLDFGTWFKDYSRTLGKMYEDALVRTSQAKKGLVNGLTGSAGKAKGPVRIVHANGIDKDFPDGAVLVCEVTTPNYVPLMQRASAIITDQGGILSHAAIIARELKKPCVVGTQNATKILKNNQLVSVNADFGLVNPL